MSKTVNIGGDRLGSGNRLNVTMNGFERSNHNLSYIWKSTMAPGTLVPFMSKVAMPGDVFEIDLDAQVRTNPTIGPLFGSFKLQLDIFKCPIRLYNSMLHNNMLNIGNYINAVMFPFIEMTGEKFNLNSKVPVEFQNINQSSLLAYLGIRNLPSCTTLDHNFGHFNAIPILCYYDIFKNYYANKMETEAYVITGEEPTITSAIADGVNLPHNCERTIEIKGHNLTKTNVEIKIGAYWYNLQDLFLESDIFLITNFRGLEYDIVSAKNPIRGTQLFEDARIDPESNYSDIKPVLTQFSLDNIDGMRKAILVKSEGSPLDISEPNLEPYIYLNQKLTDSNNTMSLMAQTGLCVKTYQSDIFNNWVNSTTYDNINLATKISTVEGSFTINQLNLSKKVYDLLQRIAAAGSTYDDWIEAAYDHSSKWRTEIPEYCGGLSKEIVFQEVISTSATADEPLGQLAGKGTMSSKHKGGSLTIKVDEPSYIMGIVSITPRISYSQGNRWDTTLRTLNDIHKPSLDQIGFQDLTTDKMHAATTYYDGAYHYRSVGKQPAWLDYMTEYDRNFGNFADPRSQMFMTLDRRYTLGSLDTGLIINDLTTYIDPSKFNYAFAESDLGAQNFWVQIAIDDLSRRKMSAKLMPNL